MTTIIVCMGGEKDGLELTLPDDLRPDVYYALPNLDEEKVTKIRGAKAKHELRDRLSRLAYRFDPDSSTEDRRVMRRTPELDRVSPL